MGMSTLSNKLTLLPDVASESRRMHLVKSKSIVDKEQMRNQHTLGTGVTDMKTIQETLLNCVSWYRRQRANEKSTHPRNGGY